MDLRRGQKFPLRSVYDGGLARSQEGDSPRWQLAIGNWRLATSDAVQWFPEAAEVFSCALDRPISQEATLHLNMLLRRSLLDAGLSTCAAKDHHQRKRPLVLLKDSTCTLAEEMGAAAVARLHADPVFQALAALAREAIGQAWTPGRKSSRRCEDEARARGR